MNRNANILRVSLFVLVLVFIWLFIGAILLVQNQFSITVYFVLMYVFYLGLLEIIPSQYVSAWHRRWSTHFIGIGFIIWITCLSLIYI